ncbi:ABC transporter permease [Fulvivirga lutea]|uniref:ABC transporter permease n=1 Tax=Fulvivirga lutea TaxID=2810512 RepID=A0A975A264_9BACT|nr:ABC transporter permease [Fulvivirga lutea]QSE98531.1 ABC transporter permease [Fulvivirga lutea]
MLKNYFKIAIRSLLKNRIYSIINVLGLSIGIASSLLILLHVEDELSYDEFHSKGDRIYKVGLERLYPDHVTNYAIVPHSFSEVMVRDFPEVENAVRMFGNPANNPVVVSYVDEKNEEKRFEETAFMAADSTFFEVFDIKLISGDPKNALANAQDMVITQEMATKYFGNEDPINKTLTTDFGQFNVKGVCENFTENSHFEFGFLAALKTFPFLQNDNFVSFTTHLYVLLNENADPAALESKFPEMVETYAAPQIEANLSTTYGEYVAAGNGYNYSLIPMEDIHLNPVKYQAEFKAGGDINDVYIFISIAVLITLIACINFMNLATARSTERAKEVGIRKTLGSPKKQLVAQFLTESIVLSIISSAIALGVVYLTLPYFNNVIVKSLSIASEGSLLIPVTVAYALIVGLLAGSYPAFVLSGFNPVSVMKGKMQTNKSMSWLRNGLVVFQFAISIILICGTLIVRDQINFMAQKDLGYNKEHLIVVDRIGTLNEQLDVFIKEVQALPEVEMAGGSGVIPVNQYFGIQFMPQGASEPITTNSMTADDDYIKTMGFEIVEGRGFSKDFNDSLSLIINQRTVDLLGVENPIGLKLRNTVAAAAGGNPVEIEYEVVGVVKDFHYMSLRDEISPFVILSTESQAFGGAGFLTARIKGENMQDALASIENKWKMFSPEDPFKYKFLDDELDKQYKSEANSGKIFGLFAALGIIIACVGLFGLAAYMAGLRTKEIGVRKTLGASVSGVVLLLSKDFTKLILIALLIAVPVSYYFMNEWLSNFAYKTGISALTFIISGGLALIIAWLTVGYQTLKAALVNPVKSLRSE